MQRFYVLLICLILGCGGTANQNSVVEQQPDKRDAAVAPATGARKAVPELLDSVDPTSASQQEEPAVADVQPAAVETEEAAMPDAGDSALNDASRNDASNQQASRIADAGGPASSQQVGTASVPAASPERFVLLAPSGPLIVELVLRINGEDYAATHERLVEAALLAADENEDGEPTWQEVANSVRFAYGQFGNLAIESDDQKRQIIRLYDRNSNGLVDRDELPRFLTRNAGGARAFSLRSSNEYRNDNRTRSLIRLELDADRDGAISDAELSDAPQRLLQHDADDDEIVVLRDFQDTVNQRAGQMSNRRRTTEPDTALLISDRLKWSYVDYSLRELYAYGDELSADDWPMVPSLFGQLDQDQNGRLSQKELPALAEVPAHIRLVADFGSDQQDLTAGDGPSTAALELEIVSEEIAENVLAVHRHGARISVELQDAEVEFFVNEDAALVDFHQVAQNQFSMLDKDQNGYLDEEEFPDRLPGFNVPLEAVDSDEDGMVYLEELVSFLDLRQAAYRGQVRARAADQEDALFTALDQDGDGRLNSKEIFGSPKRLRELDRNGDGRVQSHEIPGSMVVGLIRGNPQQDDALFMMPPTSAARRTSQAPRWFQGMDANGDGEISSREFVGDDDQFQALDTNRDGFVSVDEV